MSLKLPTASSTQPGIIDTGTQTFAGAKTFTGLVKLPGSGFTPAYGGNSLVGTGTFNVDLTPDTANAFSYQGGLVIISGAVFNGNFPVRVVYSVGGRKDNTQFTQLTANIPAGLTISSISMTATHTIRIAFSSTASSVEIVAAYYGFVA